MLNELTRMLYGLWNERIYVHDSLVFRMVKSLNDLNLCWDDDATQIFSGECGDVVWIEAIEYIGCGAMRETSDNSENL